MCNLNQQLRNSYARMAAEEKIHHGSKLSRNDVRTLAERELKAGNTIAAFALDLLHDLEISEALREQACRNELAVKRQCEDYEMVLGLINSSLDGVRYTGSPAHKILALRAELDAAQSDLAESGGKFEIVGYTKQAEINNAKSSALCAGKFYVVPNDDEPIELLRRVL